MICDVNERCDNELANNGIISYGCSGRTVVVVVVVVVGVAEEAARCGFIGLCRIRILW